MDGFVEKMKDNPRLQKEFKAAYAVTVGLIEEGTLRFKGNAKGEATLKLQAARKVVVTAFNKSQLEVRSKYKGVVQEQYEAQHPGRIAAKGFKVITARADGVMKQLVLVPKLPEGEYDVDTVDLAGVDQSEVVDDGEDVISANQQQRKFDHWQKKCLGGAIKSKENGALEQAAEFEEAENARILSDNDEASGSDDPDRDKGEEDEDDLTFLRSTIFFGLEEEERASKAGTSSEASTKRPLHSLTAPQASPAKHHRQSSPSSAGEPVAGSATPKLNAKGLSKKFEGKTPEEILAKHNLPTIKESFDLACEALGAHSLQQLTSLASDACLADFGEFKKHAVSAHKCAVALDIKVRKWLGTPESVSDFVVNLQSKTIPLCDASKHFTPNKKDHLADKMLEVIEAMSNMGIDVPLRFRAMYACEQIKDYVRFEQLGEILTALDIKTGVLKGCVAATEAEPFLMDIMAEVLHTIVSSLSTDGNEDNNNKFKLIKALVSSVKSSPALASSAKDLQTLGMALGGGQVTDQEQHTALASLDKLHDEAGSYNGILKTALVDKQWALLMTMAQKERSSNMKKADGDLCVTVQATLDELVNTDRDSTAAHRNFLNALLPVFVAMGNVENSKAVVSTLKKALAGLLQVVIAGQSKWESLV